MTRYPKAGKGSRWTIVELKAIPPAWRGDTLGDGDGLFGEVRVAGDGAVAVRWKSAFKWEGKLGWHQCGTWPQTALADVRAHRDAAREAVRRGVNPNDQKRAARIEAQAKVAAVIEHAEREKAANVTFGEMFSAWLTDGVARADGNAELRRTFEKDVLPALGRKPARNVTDSDLRAVLRTVGQARQRGRTAERMLSEMRQMFRWAMRRQPWRALLTEGNIAELVELKQVAPLGYSPGVRERVLSQSEIRELRHTFNALRATYEASADRRTADRPPRRETELAMWLCLSTACRIGELLKARWENVNLAKGEWVVPKEDTKTNVEWRVYLSPFALAKFQELHLLTGGSRWCFPARSDGRARDGGRPVDIHTDIKAISKQIGDRQMMFKNRKPLKNRRHDNTLVLAEGANGEWTPHDLRRTAATMMQQLGVLPDVIDRCQNHVLAGSKVRRHYLHHDYAEEKRAAWSKLGQRLQEIVAAPTTDQPTQTPLHGVAVEPLR